MGLDYGDPPSLGAVDTCQEGRGKDIFSGARRRVAYLTLCTLPLGSLGLKPSGLVAGHGFGPIGELLAREVRGVDGPCSVLKSR